MKIKITPHSLARQIPALRLAILQDLNPDEYVYLEGEGIDSVSTFVRDFPASLEIFTPMELHFLEALYQQGPTKTDSLRQFSSDESDKSRKSFSNVVDIHLMNIRRKLEKHQLPFYIRSYRGKNLKELVLKV